MNKQQIINFINNNKHPIAINFIWLLIGLTAPKISWLIDSIAFVGLCLIILIGLFIYIITHREKKVPIPKGIPYE